MHRLILVLVLAVGLLVVTVSLVSADHTVYVRGYYRSNGTYVQPYYRSAPNSSVYDNWSYRGNINPYTGEVGTRSYSSSWSYPSYSYSSYRSSSYRSYSSWDYDYGYDWGW